MESNPSVPPSPSTSTPEPESLSTVQVSVEDGRSNWKDKIVPVLIAAVTAALATYFGVDKPDIGASNGSVSNGSVSDESPKDVESRYRAQTAVTLDEYRRECAVQWEAGARAQAYMAHEGKGWFQIFESVEGNGMLYKPVEKWEPKPVELPGTSLPTTTPKNKKGPTS